MIFEQFYLIINKERNQRRFLRFIYERKKVQGVKKKYLTPMRSCYMIAKVKKMNEILEQALLYDFYGELLTERQKEIYGQFIQEDLSLGEIAKDAGISRQGVHDLIKRCNQTLKGYEDKLHLVEKFMKIREKVHKIDELLDGYEPDKAQISVENIRRISDEIIEEL